MTCFRSNYFSGNGIAEVETKSNLTAIMPERRVCFITLGTRGDIQPFIMAAKYLMTNKSKSSSDCVSWHPFIVSSEYYRSWIESEGIEFHPMNKTELNMDDLVYREEVADAVSVGNTFKFLDLIKEPIEIETEHMEMMEALCLDQKNQGYPIDLIVTSPITMLKSLFVAEKLNISVALWFAFPNHRTWEMPDILWGVPNWFKWLNRLSFVLTDAAVWYVYKDRILFHRDRLGLPPIKNGFEYRALYDNVPAFCAYSPNLVTAPADYPDKVVVGGFIYEDRPQTEQLDHDLELFISKTEDQSPVIYVGFGSMPVSCSSSFQNFIDKLYETMKKQEREYRVVLFVGKSNPNTDGVPVRMPGKNFFPVSKVSHALLFPKCDFIVHHGGAGTTAAAMRSGTPSLVVPVFADQFFWSRVTRKVFGYRQSLSYQKLNATKLLGEIEIGMKLKEKAMEVATKLEKENGLDEMKRWLSLIPLK